MLDFQIEFERQNNLLRFLNSVKDNPLSDILLSYINAEKDLLILLEMTPEIEKTLLLDLFYNYQELQRKVLTKILEESFPDLPAKNAVIATFLPYPNNFKLDLIIEEERQDNLNRFLKSVDRGQIGDLLELINIQKQLLERLKIFSPGTKDYLSALNVFLINYYVQKHMLSFIIETCYPDLPGKINVLNCLLPQKNTPQADRVYSLTYSLAQSDDITFFANGQKRRKLEIEPRREEQDCYDDNQLGQ